MTIELLIYLDSEHYGLTNEQSYVRDENMAFCDRMGREWSFDNMITSSKYECLDLAYDPS